MSNQNQQNQSAGQLNWARVKSELNKLADVGRIRDDLQKIATEIRKFDFHTVLTPQAQERVRAFEKRYSDLLKSVQQAQRQVDREVNKILRQVRDHHLLADVKLDAIRKMAHEQREKLTKVAVDIRKRWANGAKKGPTVTRKKTGSKTGASRSTASKT